MDTNRHGITGLDGILRLTPLLPSEWQAWAAMIAPNFISTNGENDGEGDFPGFIAAISSCFYNPSNPPYNLPSRVDSSLNQPFTGQIRVPNLPTQVETSVPQPANFETGNLDSGNPMWDLVPLSTEPQQDQFLPEPALDSSMPDYPYIEFSRPNPIFPQFDVNLYGRPFALPEVPTPFQTVSPTPTFDCRYPPPGEYDAGSSRPAGVDKKPECNPESFPIVGRTEQQPLDPHQMPFVNDTHILYPHLFYNNYPGQCVQPYPSIDDEEEVVKVKEEVEEEEEEEDPNEFEEEEEEPNECGEDVQENRCGWLDAEDEDYDSDATSPAPLSPEY